MLIDRLQKEMLHANLATRTPQARQWLLSKLKDVSASAKRSLMRDQHRLTPSTFIGSMYFFSYNPLTKAKLPYYDIFPLVIPIEIYPDGFLGLNFHYLPPKARAILLDKLCDVANNKKFDDTTKLKLSYQVLKSFSRLNLYKPCIKKYLNKQVRTKFIHVSPSEWDIAIFLPLAAFKKETAQKVWTESMDSISYESKGKYVVSTNPSKA